MFISYEQLRRTTIGQKPTGKNIRKRCFWMPSANMSKAIEKVFNHVVNLKKLLINHERLRITIK